MAGDAVKKKRSEGTGFSTRLAVHSKCGGVLRLASLGAPPATAFRYHQGYFFSAWIVPPEADQLFLLPFLPFLSFKRPNVLRLGEGGDFHHKVLCEEPHFNYTKNCHTKH